MIDGKVNLFLLYEMKVVGEPQCDTLLIAFYDTIFLFKENQLEHFKQEILEKIKLIFPDYNETKFLLTNNLRELTNVVNDTLEDIIIGYIDSDKKLHFLNTLPRDYRVNGLPKKVVDTLKRKEYIDTFEFYIEPNTHIRKPNEKIIVYHGTNSNRILNIIDKGLLRGQKSNWNDLDEIIKDKLFFTVDIEQALFHANKSCQLDKNKNKFDSLPIVLKIILPDKTKLEPDYDVERMTGEDKIYGILDKRTVIKNDSLKLSKELGIYSYKGDVYPNHIVSVFIPSNKHLNGRYKRKSFNNDFGLSEFVELSRNQIKEYINKLKEN
jgi:hypothetical protein